MQRIKIDNSKEQLVLTGLIVSTRLIKDTQPILDLNLFESKYSRTIARWCLDHYKETGEAPNVHIQDIFLEKVEKGEVNEEEGASISRVLDNISTEFDRAEQFNIDYIIKVAETFFSSTHIQKECREILSMVETQPEKAALRMEEFRSKKIPAIEGYSVLTSTKLIKKAFEERKKPILTIPGALGEMINYDLCRQNFVGILGAEKIGKTWNLLEFAIQGCRNRLNVALFQAGDMTDEQQAARIGIRLTGKSDKKKYCGELLIPTYDCKWNQDDSCNKKFRESNIGLDFRNEKELIAALGDSHITKMKHYKEATKDGYVPCTACKKKRNRSYSGAVWYELRPKINPLRWKEATIAAKKFKRTMKSKDFKLHSSSGDLTIDKVERIIDHWERTDNFVPDVVITDYADLFINTANDFRHGTNEIWKQHRFLAQRRNCLVITATQADAEAYGKKKLELSNFSEDKRKYAHVTAFYALSQTFEEKVMGITRYSHLVVRDDDFDPRREVKVMRSLQIGNPLIGSYF